MFYISEGMLNPDANQLFNINQYLIMSLWSKLTENKAVAAILATAGAGALLFWAYTQYQKEEGEVQSTVVNQQAPKPIVKVYNVHEELNKLKAEINIGNPTLDDIKRILKVLADYVKSKTLNLSNQFKVERRKKFPHEVRFSNMGEYLKFSSEGLMRLQQVIMQLQGEQGQLMASLGLNQASLAQYASQLGPFMQQLVFSSEIKLEQVKQSIQMKTDYLANHGERIVQNLIELSVSLSMQEKQFVPLFLNIIISDQAFQNEPSLDKEQFDMAYEMYKNELNAELVSLEQILIPLMGKLQTALIGDEMGGMGGYGGPGSYPSEYENMGDMQGMGGMGGMGMNEQMMMQQLEQMRQYDPQGYEQLMAMMSAQMGR